VSAIGDPLADDSQWLYLTDLFIQEFPEAYFYHASEKYAALLHDMGYYINDVGAETTLQVGRVGGVAVLLVAWTWAGGWMRVVAAAAGESRGGVLGCFA
jgi:hypothetical protein